MKLSRLASVDHPLALQFQRAFASLTAGLQWDSARPYRGTVRNFLIYLGDIRPAYGELTDGLDGGRAVHPSANLIAQEIESADTAPDLADHVIRSFEVLEGAVPGLDLLLDPNGHFSSGD